MCKRDVQPLCGCAAGSVVLLLPPAGQQEKRHLEDLRSLLRSDIIFKFVPPITDEVYMTF